MASRTRATLAIGFVVFVLGTAGAAFLGTRSRSAGSSGAGRVDVLYAARAVEAGTSGANAVAAGLVRTKAVAPAARPADAVVDPSQLSGKVAGTSIPAGAIITTAMFPDPQTRIGTVSIPAGKRALALELQPIAGVAGFAGTGDRVDIYSVAGRGEGGAPPGVRLILQAVEVLNVNGLGLPSAQGQPGGANLVYLMAVTPAEAERLIYLNEFEKLYFDLAPKGEAPVATPGAGPTQVLQVL